MEPGSIHLTSHNSSWSNIFPSVVLLRIRRYPPCVWPGVTESSWERHFWKHHHWVLSGDSCLESSEKRQEGFFLLITFPFYGPIRRQRESWGSWSQKSIEISCTMRAALNLYNVALLSVSEPWGGRHDLDWEVLGSSRLHHHGSS